jgi:hypothetical protein
MKSPICSIEAMTSKPREQWSREQLKSSNIVFNFNEKNRTSLKKHMSGADRRVKSKNNCNLN